MELRDCALRALQCDDPDAKVEAVRARWPWPEEGALQTERVWPQSGVSPGRPIRPLLVDPARVPRRSPYTAQGLAALMHAVCHIEFNAINLALDAIWRFDGMPDEYYHDWWRVAAEEAGHFVLVRDHLRSLGFEYGDFDAHDGLWAMCETTAQDVVARMALVPRTLEARGLDATPLIQSKLRQVATPQALAAVAVLDVILRDEIGHVAVGNRWFHWLCVGRGLDPVAHDRLLQVQHRAPRLKPPFNVSARRLAGFSPQEMRQWEGQGQGDSHRP
ncbi:MAG: ferritin-like domain-containing protein [Alphaproteobacteria bacterium]|nr:ferritin-like domain-containing protein [Alphaproteobacteria bacterium]